MAQAFEKNKTQKAAANGKTAGDEASSAVKSVPFPAAGSNLENYINSIYEASNQARLAQLEAAYNQSIADYNAATEKSNAAYAEQRRQTTGEAARQQAGFREVANAHGLNSGAVGQAALMQNNQLQGDLAALGRAQTSSLADIDMQRDLLRQNYHLQVQQAIAENENAKNAALYNEAVRMASVRQQEEQFNAQMNLNRLQMAMSQAAKAQETAAESEEATPAQQTVYGSEYDAVLKRAQELREMGAWDATIERYLNQFDTSQLSNAGLTNIMQSVGLL